MKKTILNLDYSPIKGPEGNIEYLIHLKNSNEGYTFNEEDYKALEHIFTHDLGSPKDYEVHFKDKEFGLVVRDIVKMRPEAAEKAFSDLINSKSMNINQINYLKQVINYITVNGYMESPKILSEAPFDRPFDIWKLFDQVEVVEIANIVKQIKNNACIK